jgi:hypothetical protein
MKLLKTLVLLLVMGTHIHAQTSQRITITAAVDSNFLSWDYSNYLNDSLNMLVPAVTTQGQQYSNVIITLASKSIVNKLSLYNYDGVFSVNPAYLYTINGADTTYIGKFTGGQNQTFTDYPILFPLVATKILLKKYGNNIPQKVQVYGLPYVAGTTADAAPMRLSVDTIIPSLFTGMNYYPWLNDTITSLVTPVWSKLNLQTVDVKLKLPSRCQISKILVYDFEGMWPDPTYIYLQKDTSLLLVGLFNGYYYKNWIPYPIPEGAQADAIVIRKYGNNIPQKVQIFGQVLPIDPLAPVIPVTPPPVIPTPTPAPVIPTPPSAANKIPIDGSRWFYLNYVPNGISGMFNGVINEKINTGAGGLLPTYECYYPLNDGEAMSISQIKMYDFQGVFTAQPASLFAIKKDGRRIPIGTFTGESYMQWVGPYPERGTAKGAGAFNLDSTITDVQYIVIKCSYSNLPGEMEFYGTYTPPTATPPPPARSYATFNKTLGMNAFSWNFVNPISNTNARIIAEYKYEAIKNFRGFRHYIDWVQLEGAEGKYYFNPCYSGGWSCDLTYERCKRDSIEVLACIKNIPDWMKLTYPVGMQSNDCLPKRYSMPRDSIQSYIEKGKLAFQFTARYGRNTNLNPTLVKVSKTPRWTADPVNVVKIGLGLVKYVECGNELDKSWRGINGYMNSYEYATLLSAFYDGHKGILGMDVGVKNADSTMQVVIGGLAGNDPSYVRGMVEWCRQNRGYKADGKIDLCWDVINYHQYSRDTIAVPLRGMAPEVSKAVATAKAFINFSEKYCYGMPVWITELGFDINQGSTQKAIPIGNKSASQTQADWTLRSSLTYLREGIGSLFYYNLNDANIYNGTKYASMGLTDTLYKRKLAMDYLYQTNQLLGTYHFNRSLQQLPVIDEYENNGQLIYAVWVPDEKGITMPCTLTFPTADSVVLYRPVFGSDNLQAETMAVVNGTVQLTATETPFFVTVKQTPPSMLYVLSTDLKRLQNRGLKKGGK